MTWLVTGGAGYIGSHVVRQLTTAGHEAVVLDDLSAGYPERVPDGVPLVVADVADRPAVVRVLRRYGIRGVVHLAARKSPVESVARPGWYYRQNIGGLSSLLYAMREATVARLAFSSSAAVYGCPPTPVVTESTPTSPVNPYGRTKLLGERLIDRVGAADGLSWLALRYFNVAGAADDTLADRIPLNLVSVVCDAMRTGRAVTVTGVDQPTDDGTGVRDYVHVADVASAHVRAVERLCAGPTARVYNVGSGVGHSVLEVLTLAGQLTGRQVPFVAGPRRPGDPSAVVADIGRIRAELGWRPRYGLTDMLASDWRTRLPETRLPAPLVPEHPLV